MNIGENLFPEKSTSCANWPRRSRASIDPSLSPRFRRQPTLLEAGGGILALILAVLMLPGCGPASMTHTGAPVQGLKAKPQNLPRAEVMFPSTPMAPQELPPEPPEIDPNSGVSGQLPSGSSPQVSPPANPSVMTKPANPPPASPRPPQPTVTPPETDPDSGVSGPLPPGFSQRPPQNSSPPSSPSSSPEPSTAFIPNSSLQEIPLSPPPSEAIVEKGQIRASIYYIYNGNEDSRGCATGEKVTLYDASGKPMIQVCPKTAAECTMQGTCMITQNGKTATYNIISKSKRSFVRVTNQCVYGFGVKSYCLDPFYTVAADPDFYSPGTVIFVPAVRGLELPNGKLHHGYLIVRDRGDNSSDQFVKGKGRFDFFTGNLHYLSKGNPFAKIGLSSRATRHEYQRVTGELADKVRKMRNFPLLPVPQKH